MWKTGKEGWLRQPRLAAAAAAAACLRRRWRWPPLLLLPACEGAGAGRLIETACKPGCVTEKHDRDQGAKPVRITVGVLREYHEGRPHWPPRHTATGHAWLGTLTPPRRAAATLLLAVLAGGGPAASSCRRSAARGSMLALQLSSRGTCRARAPSRASPGPISRRDRGSREIRQSLDPQNTGADCPMFWAKPVLDLRCVPRSPIC